MKTYEVLLEIAETDLKAAKCLYEAQLYPHAVFYLQQFTEKVIKSIGSFCLELTPEQLKREIGHLPIRIFILFLRKGFDELKTHKLQFESEPKTPVLNDLWKSINEAVRGYRLLEKYHENPDTIIKSELHNVLDQLQERTSTNILDSNTESKIDKLLLELLPMHYHAHLDHPRVVLKELILQLIDIISPLAFLILILPSNCVQDTRYPTNNATPFKKYNEESELIKSFNEIVEICRFILKNLPKLFVEFNKAEAVWKKLPTQELGITKES